MQKFPGCPIEHDAPADLAGLDQRLADDAVDLEVDQHALVGGAIPFVRRVELEVPAQFTRVGIERDDAVGVERVTEPSRGRRPGRRLAGRRINEVELRVVADRIPGRATGRRKVGVPVPGLRTRILATRDRVERPELLPRDRVERLQLAARREIAARHADKDLAVGDQRRMRMTLAVPVIGRLRLPEHLARAPVERNQIAVGRAPVDRITVDRNAAVAPGGFGQRDIVREAAGLLPDQLAGQRIEGDDAPRALGNVHEPVGDDRGCDPAAVVPHRIGPDETQVVDVTAIDLGQRAVRGHVIGATIVDPVAGLRIMQPLVRDRNEVSGL